MSYFLLFLLSISNPTPINTSSYHPILPARTVFVSARYSRPLGTIISGVPFNDGHVNFVLDRLVGEIFPHLLFDGGYITINAPLLEEPFIRKYPKIESFLLTNSNSHGTLPKPPTPVPLPSSFLLLVFGLLFWVLYKFYHEKGNLCD